MTIFHDEEVNDSQRVTHNRSNQLGDHFAYTNQKHMDSRQTNVCNSNEKVLYKQVQVGGKWLYGEDECECECEYSNGCEGT